MIWAVIWSEASRRDLRKLDRAVVARIIQATQRLAEEARGDVKRLRGTEDEFRLRVGDWRVRFTFDEDAGELRVIRVLHRKDAYRK